MNGHLFLYLLVSFSFWLLRLAAMMAAVLLIGRSNSSSYSLPIDLGFLALEILGLLVAPFSLWSFCLVWFFLNAMHS
jgi:hypothetical protein